MIDFFANMVMIYVLKIGTCTFYDLALFFGVIVAVSLWMDYVGFREYRHCIGVDLIF